MDEYTADREFMKSGICDIGIIATADIARGSLNHLLKSLIQQGG